MALECCPKIHGHQPRPATNGSSVPKTFNTCPYTTTHRVGGPDGHRHPLGVSQQSHGCSHSLTVSAATSALPPSPRTATRIPGHHRDLAAASRSPAAAPHVHGVPPAPGLSLTLFAISSVLLFSLPLSRHQGSAENPRFLHCGPLPYPTAWMMCPQRPAMSFGWKKVGFIHKIISCTISELCNELVVYHRCPYKLEHLLQQVGWGEPHGAERGCSHLPGGRVPSEVGKHPREPVIDFVQR